MPLLLLLVEVMLLTRKIVVKKEKKDNMILWLLSPTLPTTLKPPQNTPVEFGNTTVTPTMSIKTVGKTNLISMMTPETLTSKKSDSDSGTDSLI